MYTLRTVREDGLTTNLYIGRVYSFVCGFNSYEYFSEIFNREFGKPYSEENSENCIGFIQALDFSVPVYIGETSYIMSESGKTFEKLPQYSLVPTSKDKVEKES